MHARSVVLSLIGIALLGTVARTAPPWAKMDLFRHLEADPQKDYPLTDRQGPWVIMAATFSGPQAKNHARELVYELRSRFKMPAYTHAMHFKHNADSAGAPRDQFGMPKRVRYRINELDEVAVLVGDFPSIDDPTAQKTLEKIKRIEPDCLDVEKRSQQGKTDSRSLGRLRAIQQAILPDSNPKKHRGPMGHAFITTNPLLPEEYFAPKGIDRLVLEMNEPVEHSLLDCPGRYTVKVATFNGRVIIDPKQIAAAEKGQAMESQLAAAAEKAHRLTVELRKLGYEAYEFHDRHASMVTVGSFEQVGTPRADGEIEINPQVHAIMQTFGADRSVAPGQGAQVGKPKMHAGIPLDIQPVPVEVPRRSLAAQYEKPSLLGRF